VTNYPVKPSHRSRLDASALEAAAREAFGEAERTETGVRAHYGALRNLTAAPVGKLLGVEVEMDPKVDVEVAAETVRRYNRFLESATGYTSKERAKRLRKSASGPGD
jgi:hypothetical protein